MNIPQAAVDAAAEELRLARELDIELMLSAALPHLLADYRGRLEAEIMTLDGRKRTLLDVTSYVDFAGEARGIRLALSYLDEALR